MNSEIIRKIRAFTLAEVLIVVSIIGVVAMLTVPTAVKNYRNRIYSTQIRKVYSQLTVAVQTSMQDEHSTNFYETISGVANTCSEDDATNCSSGAGYFLNKYLVSVNKNCATGAHSCIATSYNTIDGKSVTAFTPEYCNQLKTGEAICLEYNSTDKRTHVYVDINSKSSPNIAGRDLFYMTIEPDGTIDDYKGTSKDNCAKNNPAGCINKLKDSSWKMEY